MTQKARKKSKKRVRKSHSGKSVAIQYLQSSGHVEVNKMNTFFHFLFGLWKERVLITEENHDWQALK